MRRQDGRYGAAADLLDGVLAEYRSDESPDMREFVTPRIADAVRGDHAIADGRPMDLRADRDDLTGAVA